MSAIAPDRLPGVLGHELRNPLASAMTGVMLVREMVDTDDPRASLLDSTLRDLDRMTQLIDGWLRLARTGTTASRHVAVDALVAEVAARHGAQVVARCDAAQVRGDHSLLARALDNLLENATQAGARTLRLAVQCLGEDVLIHVEDDGCGVPADQVEALFRPGWSGRGGHGLGLYAVANTVAAHLGRVRCVPLQRGTRFTITLPLANTLQQPACG